jgi:hypothetical protein
VAQILPRLGHVDETIQFISRLASLAWTLVDAANKSQSAIAECEAPHSPRCCDQLSQF